MANNLTLDSPEIQSTIKWLRAKNDHEDSVKKELSNCRQIIRNLQISIKDLEKSEERKEIAYQRESKRIENVLRLLTTIHNSELKKAVSLVLWWDKFGWLQSDIFERLRHRNARTKAFLDLPNNIGLVRVMDKYVGTKEFADALRIFGYGDSADERTAKKTEKRKRKSKR